MKLPGPLKKIRRLLGKLNQCRKPQDLDAFPSKYSTPLIQGEQSKEDGELSMSIEAANALLSQLAFGATLNEATYRPPILCSSVENTNGSSPVEAHTNEPRSAQHKI